MKYGFSSRTLKDARELAFHNHKIKFTRIADSGNENVLTLDKGYTNEHFFSSWSDQMAYVLGVVYTDGNIDPGSKLSKGAALDTGQSAG